MLPDSPRLDYASPTQPTPEGLRGATIIQFWGGFASYGAAAFLIFVLDSLWGMRLLGQVGLGGLHEAVLWLIGIAFVGFIIYAHRAWRWTAFTVGVIAGVLLTLLVAGVVFVLWAQGMSQLH